MYRWVKWVVNNAARDTTSGQFIAEIDGLRFIAVFAVILFHLSLYVTVKTGRTWEYDPLFELLRHGAIGVKLFFVISGFVIALPFAKGHFTGGKLPQLRQYFFRRLTRLEPPYIVNLLIFFSLIPLMTEEKAAELLPHLFASMGYLHNIVYVKSSAINGVAWSLEVELQFYVLAPLVTSVFMIRSKTGRRGLLVALIALFSIMNFVISDTSSRYHLSIFSHAQFFLTGFLLVDVYLTEWGQNPKQSLRWDVVSVIAWLAIPALLSKGGAWELVMVVPMFFAYCAAFRGGWSNRFFCLPTIYIIGGMCYTIYLYHYLLISAFGRLLLKIWLLNHIPLWLVIITASLVLVPIILLVCTLLFLFIEKPCMKKGWHSQLLERFMLGVKAWGLS